MLAPLSWLKEYIDITLSPKELGEKLTEVGLSTEKIIDVKNDKIFEFEITPNRPDLLSIMGVAKEIAAIENKKINYPRIKTDLSKIKVKKALPLTIKTDPKINPRFSSIIIKNITVKESPKWLQEKLNKIGQRSINNIVDITNFVMFELGNPLHAFDYDKIAGHIMQVNQSRESEEFVSVDGIKYHLPKGAVIIRDKDKIIDLCGIKGGKNTGTYETTKTIVLRAPVENPILIRRAGQYLSLRSEASSIFERGVNAGGTLNALNRAVDLILELAGGEIASELIDIKEQEFKPWQLKLRLERLNFILGITIPKEKVLEIFNSLGLSPKATKNEITVTIPTYRNDLKIEEDLIEEVARIYGYNNFPKTLPAGDIPIQTIPYFKDYELDEKVKNTLTAAGFNEIFTYSLINENDLLEIDSNPENVLRVKNPVSREFEFLRPTLKINLTKALKQNQPNFPAIHLFELGKVYIGANLKEARDEYNLAGISNIKSFLEIKGLLETLFKEFNVNDDPTKYIDILDVGFFFEIPYSVITKAKRSPRKFLHISKYPPVVEDLAIIASQNIPTGDIISEIEKQSPLIKEVSLLDKFENTRTFHIIYQSNERNLTGKEVGDIRTKILKVLGSKFHARLKE